MILEIGFNNYKMFKNETSISLKIDKRTKYLLANSTELDNVSIMKALAIYGPNNSGKSNLIKVFEMIKKVLLGDTNFECNNAIFNDMPICTAYIIYNNNDDNGWIKYEFSFDSFKRNYIYEKLSKITYYPSGSPFLSTIFEKSIDDKILNIYGESHSDLLLILPYDKPFLHTIQLEEGTFSILKEWNESLKCCANSIKVLKMYNLDMNNTIDAFKTNNNLKKSFITSFVKAADLSITDFKYDNELKLTHNFRNEKIEEKILDTFTKLEDKYKLQTSYGNAQVPSFIFDSTGTKKIEAISSYIYDAIKDGNLLIVDELDSGLHFSLTRAIVSIFNSLANKRGQIIFTANDLLLIDCKNLLRKDQIYFLSRDNDSTIIISLKNITANKDGLREGDSLVKRYNHGDFGSVPLPNFINELIMIVSNK